MKKQQNLANNFAIVQGIVMSDEEAREYDFN